MSTINNTFMEEEKNNEHKEEIGRPIKKSFFKRPVVLIVLAVVLVGIACGGIYYKTTKESPYKYIEVQKGTIVQEVSVTGRVKPA